MRQSVGRGSTSKAGNGDGRAAPNTQSTAFVDQRHSAQTQRKRADMIGQGTPAQRQQVQRMQGRTGTASDPIQRARAKPDDLAIITAVTKHYSNVKGSCTAKTSLVYAALKQFADDGDVKAAVLRWMTTDPSDHSEVAADHTAATIEWSEGTYVVDTTIAQFGGPAVFIGTLSAWQDRILALQTEFPATQPELERLDRPAGDSSMQMSTLGYEVRHKTKPSSSSKDEVKVHDDVKQDDTGKEGKKKEDTAKKSKCFLTSACVHHRGLADDCRELTVLREFRDGYLSAQPAGPSLIAEYYARAPGLVDAILGSSQPAEQLERIWQDIVLCVRDIDDGQPISALHRYQAMVEGCSASFGLHNGLKCDLEA